MNKLLFIGLNGYAGAGKDTVAKMLKTILGHQWNNLEECKEYYKNVYTNPTWTATFHANSLDDNSKVLCIAYADQLKMICSTIFGIPYERFYMNKSNAWVCINDKFQYTEIRPPVSHTISADEYYYGIDEYRHNNEQYWMSLREILVYVGTYVLQRCINNKTFINIVRNHILEEQLKNPSLEYVIVTDNRFIHELEYIHENNGVTISIVRDSIEQLDNIAEHELDNIENFDYIIDNSRGYDELFEEVWNLVHNNIIFKNITHELYTRDNINNYIRLLNVDNSNFTWQLCVPYFIQKIYKEDDKIKIIDPVGGPTICLNEELQLLNEQLSSLIVTNINHNEDSNKFTIDTTIMQ